MLKKATVGVTGAGGFIGKHLLSRLKTEGYKVYALVRNKAIELNADRIFHGDLVENRQLVDFLSDVDVVVNLVGGFNPPFKDQIDSNVISMNNLCEASLSADIKKIVHVSSVAVYGSPEKGEFPKENDLLLPDTSYGLAKKLTEDVCQYHNRLNGLSFIILRPPNVYGPDSDHGVITNLIDSIKETGGVVVYGTGEQERDFLYVDDLADAVIKSINHKASYEVFNVGSGKAYTINSLVSELEKVLGKEINKKYLPQEAYKTQVLVADITKAKRLLGWNPKIDLPNGLKKVLIQN